MKYQILGSTEPKAAVRPEGEIKPAISGTTKDMTNVNSEAITVNKMNLS